MHIETHVQKFKHVFSGLSRNARCGFRNSSLRQHGACSIEIRSKAHDSRCAAVTNDCTTTVGHRHTDDFCAINCAAVAQFSTTPLSGGSVRNDRLPSPVAPSDSPSQTSQRTAGGGGKTLQDCMGFWDRGTHMTKSEWRAACQRSAHRLDNLKIDDLTLGLPEKPATKRPRT